MCLLVHAAYCMLRSKLDRVDDWSLFLEDVYGEILHMCVAEEDNGIYPS